LYVWDRRLLCFDARFRQTVHLTRERMTATPNLNAIDETSNFTDEQPNMILMHDMKKVKQVRFLFFFLVQMCFSRIWNFTISSTRAILIRLEIIGRIVFNLINGY
jgi:hypothetical protein